MIWLRCHVGLAHVNPGGWIYTEGWGPINRAYVEIQDENTRIREMVALQERVKNLESRKTSLLDLEGTAEKNLTGRFRWWHVASRNTGVSRWRKRKQSEA